MTLRVSGRPGERESGKLFTQINQPLFPYEIPSSLERPSTWSGVEPELTPALLMSAEGSGRTIILPLRLTPAPSFLLIFKLLQTGKRAAAECREPTGLLGPE